VWYSLVYNPLSTSELCLHHCPWLCGFVHPVWTVPALLVHWVCVRVIACCTLVRGSCGVKCECPRETLSMKAVVTHSCLWEQTHLPVKLKKNSLQSSKPRLSLQTYLTIINHDQQNSRNWYPSSRLFIDWGYIWLLFIFGRTIPLNWLIHMDFFYNLFMNIFNLQSFGLIDFHCKDINPSDFIKNILIHVLKRNKTPYGFGMT